MSSTVYTSPAGISNGDYAPAEPGARTYRESTPLAFNGESVTAHVYTVGDVQYVSIFIGNMMVFEDVVPAHLTNATFMAWIVATATDASVRHCDWCETDQPVFKGEMCPLCEVEYDVETDFVDYEDGWGAPEAPSYYEDYGYESDLLYEW